jgi:hypothetical protein
MFNLLRYYARCAKSYRRQQPKKVRSIRPTLESLEDRLVPATFVVNSILDTNVNGTLPWAINQSNQSNPGPGKTNTIDFKLGGNQVILPTTPLPAITTPVVIDGSSNPVTGTIVLDGGNAPAGADGLLIDASGCTIEGMTIISWKGAGIQINGNNNTIAGNSIGVFGNSAQPNGNGIAIENGNFNTVGGVTAADANVISLNKGDGIIIDGGNDNAVLGNFIGTNSHGQGYLGNGNDGIHILGDADGNFVGQDAGGTINGNVISGNNAGAGIEISGAGATQNLVVGNKIGTDAAGTTVWSNDIGVKLDQGATENYIGGTATADANVISGNLEEGVYITDAGTDGNAILGDQIGTKLGGEASLGNTGNGVEIDSGATGNFVIGDVISGNGGNGVYIAGGLNNQLLANMIGTDLNGSKALPNQGNGVYIEGTPTTGNIVGGTSAADANTISGNKQDGVYIFDQCQDNTILGNFIGVNSADTKALPNQENGVEIDGNATGNYIGSTAPGMAAGNVISGNVGNGVQIDQNTPGNFVLSNQIGTDKTGTLKLPNEQNGVALFANTDNAIGLGHRRQPHCLQQAGRRPHSELCPGRYCRRKPDRHQRQGGHAQRPKRR